jgi:mono/diheme cytochrome c family protein
MKLRFWPIAFLFSLSVSPVGAADVLAPPSPADARLMGVGQFMRPAFAEDLEGNPADLRKGLGENATVIALTSATCPVSRKFGPGLAALEDRYTGQGVGFVYVNVSGLDSVEEMQEQRKEWGLEGLYLADRDLNLAKTLGALTTTEVFVMDAAHTLVYRGAVSDQYGVRHTLEEPRQHFLEDALDAVLAGKRPRIPATNAPGCALEIAPEKADARIEEVTYTREIARLVQNNCLECHRDGGAGPFSLDSYEAVSRRAGMILDVTEAGYMPPWFARDHHGNGPSPWANDRSLSEKEKRWIAAWVDAGKPRGDETDLPLPRPFPENEWTIGEPDLVLQLPEAISIQRDGFMPYQHVVVDTTLTEDRWVRGMQILPTDREVVHHVLVFVIEAGTTRRDRWQRAFGESRGFFAAYVPGLDSLVYPDGMAKRLPKGSQLYFQIHYTPVGRATSDQMRMGLLFAEEAPTHLIRTAGIANRRFEIPPGAVHHEVEASLQLPRDVRLLSFLPHMHVRGSAFRYEVEQPDKAGDRELLLDIPEYDFNWQLNYLLREPMGLPRGAVIHATGWFDNSADNPANPDPAATVTWGEQTVDEMMLGYVEYYYEDEDPENPVHSSPVQSELARSRTGGSIPGWLGRLDANGDGQLAETELPPVLQSRFERLDTDNNGVLSVEELSRMQRNR